MAENNVCCIQGLPARSSYQKPKPKTQLAKSALPSLHQGLGYRFVTWRTLPSLHQGLSYRFVTWRTLVSLHRRLGDLLNLLSLVAEEDLKSDSPFIKSMSASMVFRKEQQSKEKANPPGSSKILSKARKKAAESKKVLKCFPSVFWSWERNV